MKVHIFTTTSGIVAIHICNCCSRMFHLPAGLLQHMTEHVASVKLGKENVIFSEGDVGIHLGVNKGSEKLSESSNYNALMKNIVWRVWSSQDIWCPSSEASIGNCCEHCDQEWLLDLPSPMCKHSLRPVSSPPDLLSFSYCL